MPLLFTKAVVLGSQHIKLRTKERKKPPFVTRSMERKEPEDFSSYFYFEASGDSEEADCEIARAVADDNDALSCNGSGARNVAEFGGDESCDEHDDDDDDDDEKEDEEEKSGVYGMSYCEDDEMEEENMKSYVSFDSGQEMEKNRLFWEACLAS